LKLRFVGNEAPPAIPRGQAGKRILSRKLRRLV
jgi:hypothetical protein